MSGVARKWLIGFAGMSLVAGSIVASTVPASAVACGAVTNQAELIAEIANVNGGTCDELDITSGTQISMSVDVPTITEPVTITGAGVVDGATGVFIPDVVIDLNGNEGFVFAAGADNSTLRRVAVHGGSGNGVTVAAANFSLQQTLIGLDETGAADGNAGAGVALTDTASNAEIGTNPTNSSELISNVISGNDGPGILLDGADDNTVVSNLIGTDFSGDLARANGGGGIVMRTGADRNMIGGEVFTNSDNVTNNPTGTKGTVTPVFIIPPLGNHISGNTGNGVTISGGSELNTLSGNFIGTTRNGNARNPNTGDGVHISGSDRNTLRGCRLLNNPFVYYNVLSGNDGDGLQISNSDNTTVQANFFGTGANNTTRVHNRGNGILVDGTSTTTQVGGVIPLGNVSAGNLQNGISVRGRASKFTTFNTFGGLLAFKGAMPNGRNGLYIDATGGSQVVRTNVMSGNNRHGIEIAGRAKGVTIDPNIVGMTTNAKTKLPNGGHGLLVHGKAHHINIGGTKKSVIPQNIFSGNRGYGIVLTGSTHHNTIIDTFVGTKVFGNSGAGNSKGGILVSQRARDNVIGRFATPRSLAPRGDLRLRPSNIVAANTGIGITLTSTTKRNVVRNNFVGVSRSGQRLANTKDQILNSGASNTVVYNQTTPIR